MNTKFARLCPECSTEKLYPNEARLQIALKKNNPCKSCVMKRRHQADPNRCRGENNPMFGTHARKIWKETLPPEKFEARSRELYQLKARKSAGCNNPMFGKPSPVGSGRGISGRWKGVPFRSLLELAFLEDFNKQHGYLPASAERTKYRTPLLSGGNYFPDFVSRSGVVYEIKPSRLLSQNREKIEAGRACFGAKFRVVTEKDLPPGIEDRIETLGDVVLNTRSTKSEGFLRLEKKLQSILVPTEIL